MSIQSWPKHDRPRERLIKQGAQALSDAELLAIFLRTGLPGKSAVDLAREMISQFGGLQNLNRVSLAEWVQIRGLGEAKYAQLRACLEMAKRCLSHQLSHELQETPHGMLASPDLFEQFVRAQIGLSEIEHFLVIALDSQLKVLDHKILSSGTVNKTVVFPREVLKFAIQTNAPRIMMAHNHPSDCCTPSSADDRLTHELSSALALVDIELVDHLVVGPNCGYSYRLHNRPPF
ncbi:DNA repair protein RadC [Limnobacter sp.]|jgi:DNA repair protein RadC|uniref:RadC family protein n=1 Tax=Limnobacter sp. TaxID=2003368 RepID=UPI0027371365|nr:DNA repair protein RadC [Limnobacter sp.]MDP3272880.1 DNA repair protein RadC [Limnobacter sp.]